jgi:chemotaxis-related protein WspB
MLFLLFQLDTDWYALDAGQIVEVLPMVEIKQIPQAPPGIAGLFNYRGQPVPAVDLSALALGTPARRRISTRLVLVHYPDAQGVPRLLGLVAEKATEALRREAGDFREAGLRSSGAPWLGPVCADARGMIQWVQAQKLLSPEIRDLLFREAAT